MGSEHFIPEEVIFDWMNNTKVFEKYTQDDIGAAQLVADIFQFRHRYNSTAKEWFSYNEQYWQIDRGGLSASADLKTVARILNRYASFINSDGINKYAASWNNSNKRRNILNDTKDVCPFAREDCDKDDFALNLENGTLILRLDGEVEFVDHNPEMLLCNIARVTYQPGNRCERWIQFVTEIMQQDETKIRYLQKLAGLCLTGNTSLEKMWFLFGSTTRNGKSTFIETILRLLGTYGTTIRAESLAIKNNPDSRTASPDIAKLAGKRIVVCSEPPKRMLLDEALIKNLVGNDTITARFLNENQFEYIPKFKLICNTNYLPVVSDLTIFQSDRIQVIEFGRHFEPEEQDKTLKAQFSTPEALTGILNWMIEGWKLFCKEGLNEPPSVKIATAVYKNNSDKIANFLTLTFHKL